MEDSEVKYRVSLIKDTLYLKVVVAVNYLNQYNRYMEKYGSANTTVSLLNYHFVFCPRYRRKIFLNTKVEERFKEIVKETCETLTIDILAMECIK